MIQAEDTSQEDEPLSTSLSWINNDVKHALGIRQRAYEIKRRINNEMKKLYQNTLQVGEKLNEL